MFAPTVVVYLLEKRWDITICVPGNGNSPEGGTDSLSAVREIFSLRWIGG